MFYKDGRLALLIDVANLYGATKAPGFDIDYRPLRQKFMRRGVTRRAPGFRMPLEFAREPHLRSTAPLRVGQGVLSTLPMKGDEGIP